MRRLAEGDLPPGVPGDERPEGQDFAHAGIPVLARGLPGDHSFEGQPALGRVQGFELGHKVGMVRGKVRAHRGLVGLGESGRDLLVAQEQRFG